MNDLVKALVEGLIDVNESTNKKIVGMFGGGFKPPTSGHLEVVKRALAENPELDELIILVGSGVRDSISQEESLAIWNMYKKYLPSKVTVMASPKDKPPIGAIYSYAKKNPNEIIYWFIGAREGNEGDFQDIEKRTRSLRKLAYQNVKVKEIITGGAVSGTKARQALLAQDKETFLQFLPDIPEVEEIWDMLKDITSVNEAVAHEMSMEDFNDVGEALRNPKKAKAIYGLLLQMFPKQKEVIDYNYKNDAFAEMKRVIHGIDKYKLIGPVTVQPKEMKLAPEVEAEREKKFQQFVKGEIDKYFRTDKTDPRKVDVSKFPPITMDEEGFVSDGNHRAFIAKKQNKPLKAYKYIAAKNDHPNVAKILKLVKRSLKEDKMSSINLDQKKSTYSKEYLEILNRFPETLQREIIDERPKGDQNDIDELKGWRLNKKNPYDIPLSKLLKNSGNLDSISRTPKEVVNKINSDWGTKVKPGTVYDQNPGRYFEYAKKFSGATAKPSMMVNGIIAWGVGRFIAALLRGDKTMKVWDIKDSANVNERVSFSTDFISQGDVEFVDDMADRKLAPIDVDLTGNHFFDRLNDPRNFPDISIDELEEFFDKLADEKEAFIEFLRKYKDVVVKDTESNLNIPFMKRANKAIAKTIMRKKNFKTPNVVLPLDEGRYDAEVTRISRMIINYFKDVIGKKVSETFEDAGELKGEPYDLIVDFIPSTFKKLGPLPFIVNAAGSEDDIAIQIDYQEERFPGAYDELIPELKDAIRHELEHVAQYRFNKDAFPGDVNQDDLPLVDYLTLDYEIPAFVQGIYKNAKTRKISFSQALQNFLDERIDELTPAEEAKVKKVYLDYAKKNLPAAQIDEGRKKKKDPKKGTGKKPKGSGRRLYTDEDPKDTVRIKFSTRQDIVDTLNKKSFKAKSHARQSQVINLIHQRVRAAYGRAKKPDVKKRLKTALDYITKRKEASKAKTKRLQAQKKKKKANENVAPNHNQKAAPYGSGYKKMEEGDTYEKMAAKGKKSGNLKQGTVRKRLNIPKGEKVPMYKIDKEISRLKKMDKDKDKKGVQLGDKNQKYYKALQLAKTLKSTTNLKEDLNQELAPQIASLTQYMGSNGLNLKPYPKIKFINNDINNAEDLLGRTAYYDPNQQLIALYTMGRHPKDILRSYAHELIHHHQNLNNTLDHSQTTNTNEDDALDRIEREAYENGNILFRNWEDSIKNK